MNKIDFEAQLIRHKARVKFLKEWVSNLLAQEDYSTNYEKMNRVFNLSIEIDAKEALIVQREKDYERWEKETDKLKEQAEAGYPAMVKKLDWVLERLPKQAVNEKALVEGILERSKGLISIDDKVNDYQKGMEMIGAFESYQNQQKTQPTMKKA